MSDPFLAEIRMFAGTFAPKGWAMCNGQLLPISQNTALFSLLGTNYGGDGKSTFALPNLAARIPLQQGQGAGLTQYQLGQSAGAATATVGVTEMPSHTHVPQASHAAGNANAPAGAVWATPRYGRGSVPTYTSATPDTALNTQTVQVVGSTQPHNNLPPYLVVNFIIALQGMYPPRP